MNVHVICHGNICRSPLAEHLIRKLTRIDVLTSSSGVGIKPDKAPRKPPKAIIARGGLLGLDLTRHRPQATTEALLAKADFVLYMGPGNFKRLDAFEAFRLEGHKFKCLANYGGRKAVPDPYYLKDEKFDQAVDFLIKCCHNFIKKEKLE